MATALKLHTAALSRPVTRRAAGVTLFYGEDAL